MLHFRANPWVTRLNSHDTLSAADTDYVDELVRDHRLFATGETITRRGDPRTSVPVVMQGFVVREYFIAEGQRQITGCLVPGDACDISGCEFPTHQDTLTAILPSSVAFVPCRLITEILSGRPVLARALLRAAHADMALTRGWIVGLGRRNAASRLAHFVCEMHQRLDLVGAVANDRFELPMTQSLLGDILGLSTVHVNRTVSALKSTGLIAVARNTVQIRDLAELQRFAGFDPAILHRLENQSPVK